MADKLSEASWAAFTKKRAKLDDGALVKALSRWDKTLDEDHAGRIEAADDIVSQVKKLVAALARRVKELGDKEFRDIKDQLYELLDEAERQSKKAHAAKAEAEAQAEEETDSPVLLTTKMIPLLRELRKGEARMHAMITTAGKNTAVLIMRRAIPPSRRKLLAEFVDAKGGAKFIVGECLYEEKALTFVVQSKASGLAKRVRQALLDQTELRIKVRVRGEDGELELEGEDDAEADAALAQAGLPPAPPLPERLQTAPEAPPAPDAAALRWAQSLPPLRERLEAALRAQHPEASKLRALIAYAAEKVQQRDHVAALAALDRIESLLDATPPPPLSAPMSAAAAAPAGPRPLAPAIVYTQTRLAWVATRTKVQAELRKLEAAILERYKGQLVRPQVAKSVRQFDRVLALFDESLSDKLDGALNSADEAEKQRWHAEARTVIEKYQGYLADDPLVQALDDNPFLPVAVRATLDKTLSTLAAKIV
jgi:hypothetical protein